MLEVLFIGDGFSLVHLAAGRIDHDLGEPIPLHGIDRQLKLAILDFELGRDRLALRRVGLQSAVQRDLRSSERLGQLRTLLGFVRSLCRHEW